MLIELTNLKDLDIRKCDHCFCIDCSVKTGDEVIGQSESGVLIKPVKTPHKKCCNCGMKTKVLRE